MNKVVVTGGSGGAGEYVVEDLLANGYAVVNVDRARPRRELCPFIEADLGDYDRVVAAFEHCDAVVHFAGNPHPDEDFRTGADRLNNNTLACFNAFQAAAALGIRRVVWASSETVYGYPFASNWPELVPLRETDQIDPQTAYAISKAASERAAELMARLHHMTLIGLRFSNILYRGTAHPANYRAIPSYWSDSQSRKFNLWGYIDARDAARATRLALEADLEGAHVFNIAAEDTIMSRPSADLLATALPMTGMRPGTGVRQALLDCSAARQALGFVPQYVWADVLASEGIST